VTAPRSVKLEENVLLVVLKDHLIEAICHDGVGGVFLDLGYRLALDRSGNVTFDEFSDKVADGLGVYSRGLRERVFKLLLNLLNSESGPLGFLQVERLGMVGELSSIISVDQNAF
jgi:hypothetical protein